MAIGAFSQGRANTGTVSAIRHLRWARYARVTGFLLCTLNLQACLDKQDDDKPAGPDMVRNVLIESATPRTDAPDTVTHIQATVFLPPENPSGPYPLIIHSHRWGGSRVSAENAGSLPAFHPDNPYFELMSSIVPALSQAGYAVVSFDQRGFGRGDDGDNGTEGGTHGMSPNFEIEDTKAVIDWAVANLNPIMDQPGDPRLGLVGGSYGGAFQLMTSAEDERVDAIVPTVTWFDLEQALAPNGILKKGWGMAICTVSDELQLSAEIQQACDELLAPTNRESDDTPIANNLFFENGLSYYSDQPSFSMPSVNALIIQGIRDSLFNLNQADKLFHFLNRAGGDVSLLLHDAGHRLVKNAHGSTPDRGQPFCGSLDTVSLTVSWLNEKLRGMSATQLPDICLPLDSRHAIHLDAIPLGSHEFRVRIPPTTVTGISENNDKSMADEALFFPLLNPVFSNDYVIAGIPVARLLLEAGLGNNDPTPASGPNAAGIFIGVGIKRNEKLILVDDQVQPVLSTDVRVIGSSEPIELVGIGEKLQVGDQVGALLYGKYDQFENHGGTNASEGSNWRDNIALVSGTIDLPIFKPETIDYRED